MRRLFRMMLTVQRDLAAGLPLCILEERLRTSGKTPTICRENGGSIVARAPRLPGRRTLAQLASTCISEACVSLGGIPPGVVALLGRDRGHFTKNVVIF